MNNSRYTLKELSKDLKIDVKILRENIKQGHLRASKSRSDVLSLIHGFKSVPGHRCCLFQKYR